MWFRIAAPSCLWCDLYIVLILHELGAGLDGTIYVNCNFWLNKTHWMMTGSLSSDCRMIMDL